MNKKIIIPGVLCLLVIVFIISQITGGGKIVLDWEGVTYKSVLPDSITLKVYVENSGSMDAYMCSGSNLKDAVYDFVSDLKKNTTQCNLYYVNSQVIPCNVSLDNYIKDLTPQSFAKAGGNRVNTDLRDIFNKVLVNHSEKTVSVFVSDCILDIPQSATDYFGNCQVSIKNSFNEALSKYPNLAVEIIKLQSKFNGFWYCGNNKEKLTDVKRPYYIWVIGDKQILAMLNQKAPIENVIGGIQEYCAYSTSQPIPFDITQKRFAINHANKISVDVLVDLRNSLQEKSILENKLNYTASNPLQVEIKYVKSISDIHSLYSHVINVELSNPETLKEVSLSFSYPQIPRWVRESNDSTGVYSNSVDKTTGILYLVQGVSEAYKEHIKFGVIDFNIKNK